MKTNQSERCRRRGEIAIIVAITLVFLGGLLLYLVYQVIKAAGFTAPYNPGLTNTVQQQTLYIQQKAGYPNAGRWFSTETQGAPGAAADALNQPIGNGFSMQYGVSATNLSYPVGDRHLWLSCGTSLQNPEYPEMMVTNAPIFDVLEDDTNAFDVLTVSWNVLNRSTLFEADQVEVWTNASVVIQSSTNMIDWRPVFTNGLIQVGYVYAFTDSNAPPGCCFYRLELPPVTDPGSPSGQ